ncbi:Leucyl aminopeptidase yscIV [Clonorchis sinensis]|uniref:Leucine aminopeptidase 2 n=2 Tax=Clonorchis sinensis TaxID=79923 RepID=C6FWH0_CLOSI|nr:leucine aminopeptidase 2 [Clonorchis sinensis]KAG5445460.1 Leucyl aminopeptidase yscIV [Clonorchis sinensis]GAA54204.1 leucyl aminopeptidase [Clonorchis sinensis]
MQSPLLNVENLLDDRFDAIVFVNDSITEVDERHSAIKECLVSFSKVNPKIAEELTIVPFPKHPSGRLIFSPTGSLNTDLADVRNVYDASCEAIKRAIALGCKAPLLCVGPLQTASVGFRWMERRNILLNVLLGAYHAAYTPLEVREMLPEKYPKVTHIGLVNGDDTLFKVASAIEEGRWIARDIGGSDPERMAAPAVVQYLQSVLSGAEGITMQVEKVDGKKYPLMAAVNRAASVVSRHDGRVVHLNYVPPNSAAIDTTLYLIGKGITYDTGGADVKAGGVMAGMHRDKCGAAAIAGFFMTLSRLQPPALSVSASLAFVRNSIGPDSYVSDEIIVSRAGKRVRIGNTDAEGRMVMADLLCEAKEKAVKATNPFLFTIATLTGHVVRAYKHFTAVMDNGPARLKCVSQELQSAGDLLSDLAEISTVRKEDYEFNKGRTEYEDILQCNNLPSSATARGHQVPAAFLVMASGLDKHGMDSPKPLPYTHVDVAGSAAEIHVLPTAAPLMMFASRYILPRVGFL